MGLSDPLKQLEYKPATCWSASLTTTVFHPHLEPPSMCTYLQVGLNGMLFQHEITLEELVTIIRAMPSELILSRELTMPPQPSDESLSHDMVHASLSPKLPYELPA